MGFFTSKEDEANLQNAHHELIGAPHKARSILATRGDVLLTYYAGAS